MKFVEKILNVLFSVGEENYVERRNPRALIIQMEN